MDSTWWRQADELDEDQRKLLTLPPDGNYLIVGPPGSGKTNILLLRGIYLRASGFPNCRVLAFTRTLVEFIRSGVTESGKFPPQRVSTHAAWSLHLLRLLGANFEYSREGVDHDTRREERHQALEEAVRRSGHGADYYDCVLVDEIQDYWASEIKLLSRLTNRFFAVGDSRQRIYDRNEGLDAARDIGCVEHKLKFHYRIGRAICRAADRLLPDPDGLSLETFCQYREADLPSSVEAHQLPDLESQIQAMVERIKMQLRAYPGEWIGVLTPRRYIRDRIEKLLAASELTDKVMVQREEGQDRRFDKDRPICLMVANSAKGTEFRAVHLITADEFRPYFTRELGFTVLTRAKTAFDLYHTGDLDGPLEAAVAERRVPDIEELFS